VQSVTTSGTPDNNTASSDSNSSPGSRLNVKA
jgi:hypothetical protein